jgi:hypothetical protein
MGLMNSISALVSQLETSIPNLLTTVRLGPTLFLASDFSGQHNLANYESYSFLLADLIYLWLWEDLRKEVRNKYLSNSRRISFKALNDRQKQRALIPFLKSANCIPGLSITLLVAKDIPSLLNETGKLDISHPEYEDYQSWKPQILEKLLRVGHFAAMLVAAMSAPKQNLLWITDEDPIVSNEERLKEACKIIGHLMNHYLSHNLGHFQFGTTKSDDGSLALEDLAAIPDLVAGALCELAPNITQQANLPFFTISPEDDHTEKSKIIMDWFADPIHTLKKLIICLDYDLNGNIIPHCIHFQSPDHPQEFFWYRDFIKRIDKNG